MKLTSETIKNAVFKELQTVFPNISVYKEQSTLPNFPHFFINQLNLSTSENRKNHYFQTYLMNIRYRQVADVSNEAKIEQELDEVGHKLIEDFVKIQLNNRPHKIKEAYYEKVDGVLHFSCQIKIQVEKQKEDSVKMEHLENNIVIKQ